MLKTNYLNRSGSRSKETSEYFKVMKRNKNTTTVTYRDGLTSAPTTASIAIQFEKAAATADFYFA